MGKGNNWNDRKMLAERIYEAIANYYDGMEDDKLPSAFEFAVNPKTYEVMVIESYSQTPKGWNYECITDADEETIWEVANSYFDLR